jgi:hypothetical protein
MIVSFCSAQAEERQDRQDHDHEADKVDDAVHFCKTPWRISMSHKVAMPYFGCAERTILVQLQAGGTE